MTHNPEVKLQESELATSHDGPVGQGWSISAHRNICTHPKIGSDNGFRLCIFFKKKKKEEGNVKKKLSLLAVRR